MNIALAADHGGYEMKALLIARLAKVGLRSKLSSVTAAWESSTRPVSSD